MAETSIPIGELRANARETLRVSLDQFQGHQLVNFRKWFPGEDGNPRPGKGGAVNVRHLPRLAELIGAALAKAVADGLIPEPGGLGCVVRGGALRDGPAAQESDR
jgi:transcriptional coactivator p15 (PC4)